MEYLQALEQKIAQLDEQLRAVAKRSFDFNDPDWVKKLAATRDPLDETGTRSAMESLITKTSDHYAGCPPETRQAIRVLFDKYDSVSWASGFAAFPSTSDGFRRKLLLFSVLDQGKDSRDAILWMQDFIAQAESAGISVKPLIEEVARLSSEMNKFGMGSTRDLLMRFVQCEEKQ